MSQQSVESYIQSKSGQTAAILEYLHDQIMAFPQIETKIRYHIPFFYRKSWICYLNPSKDGSVELVFTRGNELSNEQGLLMAHDRKQVRGIRYTSLDEIDVNPLLEIVQEALLLDEEVPYASKRTKK